MNKAGIALRKAELEWLISATRAVMLEIDKLHEMGETEFSFCANGETAECDYETAILAYGYEIECMTAELNAL